MLVFIPDPETPADFADISLDITQSTRADRPREGEILQNLRLSIESPLAIR
jgi:hypothetical protein